VVGLTEEAMTESDSPSSVRARTRKLAVIGADGYQKNYEDLRVDCFPWHKISNIKNLRDYDTIVISLLSVDPEAVNWTTFISKLNPFTTVEILKPGGSIIVIGDPRFDISVSGSRASESKSQIPFLAWTGMKFQWDDGQGETLRFAKTADTKPFEKYVDHIKRWKYSLRDCQLDRGVLEKAPGLKEHIFPPLIQLRLHRANICQNRYDLPLVFLVYVLLERLLTFPLEILARLGPIIFLPEVDLNEDETLILVLRELCGIEFDLPEPAWVAEMVAPGQEAVDTKIQNIGAQVKSLQEDLRNAQLDREGKRTSLKLLYQRGEILEAAVREMFRNLGAHVEDPQELGKDDGTLKIKIGAKTYEGVLEIKSTRNPQFTEEAIRQLVEWRTRIMALRKRRYKGIFVGNSSIGAPLTERMLAFSDSWKRNAEIQDIAAIKTEDLYRIYLLHSSGKLKHDEFWRSLFNTNGVFDLSLFLGRTLSN
jgi:hypothetical protein